MPTATAPAAVELIGQCQAALTAAQDYEAKARAAVAAQVAPHGKVARDLLQLHQFAAHGLAWVATYVAALEQALAWATHLQAEGRLGALERLILQAGFGEYLGQLRGGIPMSQCEMLRPADLGLNGTDLAGAAVDWLAAHGNTESVRLDLARLIEHGLETGEFGNPGLDDTMTMVQDQFRRFASEKVQPFAQDWHLKDELIPLGIISEMSEMGVFGLTIPEDFGGSGMGKLAMCIVSEELSRGYIGVGSLGTRSEIAAELILNGGTPDQKAEWLPKIASGEILPTAVFTEPNTGSDLGSLRTRAVKDGDQYLVTGNKTWITHAARADVMTLLVRTDPATTDYRGLSMFLATKPRGAEGNPFPAPGMTGGEIQVLGYRGMKEFELGFDGFAVPAANLLGRQEGQGFKHLMTTFESARIQTGARAVGVAQAALESGLRYARERVQFGKPIYEFPRVHGKIAMMVVETMLARQLTYAAARRKDEGKRCDLEAGMAKLLAARVAWANADNALQIHGGNGYALEYPISRILCDARILNVFEGAAEIQAEVIARRLLDGGN